VNTTEAGIQWNKPLRNWQQLTATLGMVWLEDESPPANHPFIDHHMQAKDLS